MNINIPLQKILKEFEISQTQMNEIKEVVKDEVVMEIHRNWMNQAKQNLNQTREGYLRSLMIIDSGRFSGSIVLTGMLPNMIESGCSAFDMKQGFMKSAKVKYNKTGGWYITIPFRMAVPSASGFSSIFSGVLPQEIYDLVKNFSGKETMPLTEIRSSPQRLKQKDIPKPYDAPKTRERVIAQNIKRVYDTYVNKSSIYAGLQRDSKFYEKTGQSTYNTFRRAGANGDPLSWIHTGLDARNFAEKAVDQTNVQLIVDNTVDKMLNEFGFGED